MSRSARALRCCACSVLLTAAWLTTLRGAALQQPKPKPGGSRDAAALENPVAADARSVAQGKRTYARLCVRCHGPLGKGDGGGAGAGGQPADLTDAAWEFGGSDGEIFTVIHEGTSADMDAYAERISDTDIWHLVNFIRSIGPQQTQPGHR